MLHLLIELGCDTNGCSFKNKSVRAKTVLDYATQFLAEHLFTTESNYEQYVTDAKEYATVQAKALDSDIASLTKQIGNKEEEYNRTKAIVRDKPSLGRHYNLDEVETELKAITKDHAKLVKTRKQLKTAILTYSEYLELFENIGVELREMHDMALLDQTIRKFCLNFVIKDGAVSVINLNEPWAGFVKSGNFLHGRG